MTYNKRLIYLVASLLLSVAVITWLLRTISPSEVLAIVRNANRSAVLCFVFLSLATSVFRLLRYRLLLRISGESPSVFPLFLTVLVRNLFSDLLPARLGSLIYIYIVNARLGVGLGAATSSFALSFLFDFLALVPIAIYAAFSSMSGQGLLSAGNLTLGAFLIGGVSAALIQLLPWLFEKSARVMTGAVFTATPALKRCAFFLLEAQKELLRARSVGVYARVFLLSVAVRLGKYLTLYAFLLALLIPEGYTMEQLAFSRVFPGLCAAEFAASLPVSGIAGVGAYQGAWVFTFTLLGFPLETAKLTSLAHHLFTQAWGYSLGVLALILLVLPVWNNLNQKPAKQQS